jgi:hypothetical protein
LAIQLADMEQVNKRILLKKKKGWIKQVKFLEGMA